MLSALENGETLTSFDSNVCRVLKPIKDDQSEETIAFLLIGDNTESIAKSAGIFSQYAFFITIGATLIIAVFVLLFAERLIVKNVRRLSSASELFTSDISGGKPEKVSAGISSHDEIGDLSGKFDVMQDAIIGYIDSLEEKTAKEERMKAELSLAARIQSEALPKGGFMGKDFFLESFLKPAKEVGGDFYDYFMLDEYRLFFCIADVTGKGIPAALFMMRAKELIKSGVSACGSLPELAYTVNNELCSGNEENLFITAFFGVFDTKTGKLSYLRAGHEQPILLRNGETKHIGDESNCVLGVFEDTEFIPDEVELIKGDVLLMYTDGLNEGVNTENEEFGYERIEDTIRISKGDIAYTLFQALERFKGDAEQFDDVTMLVLSLTENR